MSRTLFGTSMLLSLLFVFNFFTACENRISEEHPAVVAHRGAMTDRPENTMSAYSHAVQSGADMVEIDLRTSRDGHLFILHDATLDRTTDGTGIASELTIGELSLLDAGSWFSPDYAGETIPTFREVLRWAAKQKVRLLLDLKESGPEFADRVTDAVVNIGMEQLVVVGVRSPRQAQEFRERLPHTPQLAFISSPDEIDDFSRAGTEVIRLWLRWLVEDPDLADRVRQAGCKLMINGTTGHPEEAMQLLNFRPDWILIDDPGRLLRSFDPLERVRR